ncbi:SLATT domain-containing protein [Latilactobacillus curvatus]|uniref:SLATT domain-containing protein n=1 Tax=Latilactobacillus curvatus TaxID=28038 RepID=UPI00346568D8|nr:SLATT domain-containing protein [Latilactobacillus curvatus]
MNASCDEVDAFYAHNLKLYKRYFHGQNLLKNLQIIISAITSGGIISTIFINKSTIKIITATISTISLGISLYFRNYDSKNKSIKYKLAYEEAWNIKNEYKSFLNDYNDLDIDSIKEKRDELTKQFYNLKINND